MSDRGDKPLGSSRDAAASACTEDERWGMKVMDVLRKVVRPLLSRKVRVALATVLAAYAAEYGLGVSEEMVLTILGVGAALILGIAHEDQGLKQGTGGSVRS